MRAGGTSILIRLILSTLSYEAWLVLSSGSWPRLLVHLRIRHLPALPRSHEGRDGEAFALAAPVEPLVNKLLREPGVVPGLLGVADDAVVVPVTLQLALEGGDDFGKRKAPRLIQPVLRRRHCGTEFLGVGALSALHSCLILRRACAP